MQYVTTTTIKIKITAMMTTKIKGIITISLDLSYKSENNSYAFLKKPWFSLMVRKWLLLRYLSNPLKSARGA